MDKLTLIQTITSGIIAIFAISNFILSKTIKNENQQMLKHFIASNIVDSSFGRFKEQLKKYEKFLKESHSKNSS